MNPTQKFYSIHLKLTALELAAITGLANRELRDIRSQAHYLLRQKLLDVGMLTQEPPEPVVTPAENSQSDPHLTP